MAFDGINFRGQSLKIRRPHDYQPTPGIDPVHVGGPGTGLMQSSIKSLLLLELDTKYRAHLSRSHMWGFTV